MRKKSKEELLTFTWDAVYDEFQQKCPRFLQFLHSATANPSALTNKVKDSAQIRAAMCSAGCKLVSIFSDDMSALRCINSVMAKKGGLKKVGFAILCATYDIMSYTTTSRILESLGENHDNMVCQWRASVEVDLETEAVMQCNIHSVEECMRDNPLSPVHIDTRKRLKQDLQNHQRNMHPGKLITSYTVIYFCSGGYFSLAFPTLPTHVERFLALTLKSKTTPAWFTKFAGYLNWG